MKNFNLIILSKENKIDVEATQVTVNSENGYLTILANHIPLITTLKEGNIEWILDNKKEYIHVNRGIMKVDREKVKINQN